MSWLERAIMFLSPSWGQSRARARFAARHFEAASVGRRTSGWSRTFTDANSAASGASLARLRAQARDLVRNNPWAHHGLDRIATSVVGWGIRPSPTGRGAAQIMKLWDLWADTTQCDAAGQLTFYGLQHLAMRTVAESGEVLIRRRFRRPGDKLAIPMQLQILEPDFLDTDKDGIQGESGGKIIQGIEFDRIGRRAAYWMFDEHPGGRSFFMPASRRIPATEILHVYQIDRPGQVRGPSWFAPVDVKLHEFDEYEDATLMKQKIAACMAAFVTDLSGTGAPVGVGSTDAATNKPIDSLEPGMIMNLPVGKQVEFANPPQATDYGPFSASQLRGVAAGLGITYEDLTGDYSQTNYSSARMGRISAQASIHNWRWNMLIPQFCAPAWMWMLEALELANVDVELAPAEWTPAPMPMLDPEKEGAATKQSVRMGQMTHDEMIREQGRNPKQFWKEYADGLKRLDELGITLDSDPRKTSGAGQLQAPATTATVEKPVANGTSNGVPKNGAKPAAPTADA